jgi:hypothetical protein
LGTGGAFGQGLKFKGASISKDVYISKDLGVKIIFLRRTYSVNL